MKRLIVGVALIVLFAVGGVVSTNSLVHDDGHVEHGSPSYAGTGSKSTLENGDTLNCVVKVHPGWFIAKSRTFNNGNVTDVVRADKGGEVNCHFTGVNNGAHQAGSDPGSLDGPTYWGDKNKHGT